MKLKPSRLHSTSILYTHTLLLNPFLYSTLADGLLSFKCRILLAQLPGHPSHHTTARPLPQPGLQQKSRKCGWKTVDWAWGRLSGALPTFHGNRCWWLTSQREHKCRWFFTLQIRVGHECGWNLKHGKKLPQTHSF